MNYICLILATLTLLLASHWTPLALGDVYALPDGITQLKGQSYSLRAKISTIVGGKLCKLEVSEYFSSWQRRSRIDYGIRSKYASDWLNENKIPRRGTVQADDRNVLLVRERTSSGGSCVRLSRQLVLKMFTMGALGTDEERTEPQSLIGPSRLLHFIANRVYKLVSIDTSELSPRETFETIPNMVKLVYNELPNDAKLSLFYSNNQANNLAHGVPREMHLQLANKTLVIYEFQQVTLLNQNSFVDRESKFMTDNRLRFQHASIQPEARELAHDLFSWSRGSGCSRALRKSQLDDRLDLVGLDRREYRFSFTAQPNYLTRTDPVEMIVGYEPTISTLRVNKISRDETIESTINYQQMRNYHVLKKHIVNMDEFEASFSDSQAPQVNDRLEIEGGGRISCVMTQTTAVSARDPLSRGLKLGDMLLGSIKFTYLGRAKVRGIDALMFESPESEWPIWLEPPALIYKSDKLNEATITKQTMSRPAGGTISDSEYRLNTVVYLSAGADAGQDQARAKSDYQEPIALDNKLLLVEFYEFLKKSNKLLRTFSVPIYNFAWHIVNGGIGNRNYVDFFAIADDCPRDDEGVKEQARVEMVLDINHSPGVTDQGASKFDGSTSDDQPTDGWLSNDIKRNLAILQAIHHSANLPTSLIYDFQSRLGPRDSSKSHLTGAMGTEISTSAELTRVAISFRMVNHVRHLDELIYLGVGCIKLNATREFRQFSLKFRDCGLLAAHLKLETVFGFDSTLDRCYVRMAPSLAGPSLARLVGSTFDTERMDCSPKLEIYKTTRELDETDRISEFKLKSSEKFGLFPVLDDGTEDARAGDPVWYGAKVVKFRLNQPSHATSNSANLQGQGRPFAFGLVSTSAMNTLIEANLDESTVKQKTWAATHLQQPLNELTFGQCQTQCLVSAECDAFSICRRGGQSECVLTRANLRSEANLLQLNEIARNRSFAIGRIFEIEVTTGDDPDAVKGHESRVALRKHPACELHFKDYMALTRRGNVAKVRWAHDLARLKPVRDRGECAQRCLQRTISALEEDVEPLSKLSAEALRGLDEGGNKLRELHRQRQAARSKICHSFLYLDVQSCDASLIEKLHTVHAGSGGGGAKSSGFCSITGEEPQTAHREMMDMVGFEVVSEKHSIDFSVMYDKHFGISLMESSLTDDEKTALNAIVRSDDDDPPTPLTPDDLKVLEAFVGRGENNVIYFHTTEDVASCAKVCFLTQPVWPACKSFSVEETISTRTDKHILTCRLNSVTLSEVLANERYDLIREQKSPVDIRNDSVKVNLTVLHWHYEPRRSFIGRSIDWTSELLAERDLWGQPEPPVGNTTLHLNLLWFLACVFVTLILGTKLGIDLGKRFIMNLKTIPEDKENLVNGMAVDNSDTPGSGVSIGFKSLATCYEEPENEAKAEQENDSNRRNERSD